MYDCDKAAERNARMWKRIGASLERAAYSSAKFGNGERAITLAKAADACFWQATGEGDNINLKDVAS